jgi:hypothetical protein
MSRVLPAGIDRELRPVIATSPFSAAQTSVQRASRWPATIVGLALLFGLYLPSSRDGVFGPPLVYISAALLLATCASLLLRRHGFARDLAIGNAVVMNLTLLLSTLFYPTGRLAYGVLAVYFLLSLVYCLNLRDIAGGRFLRGAFIFANIVNFALAAGILFAVPAVTDFLVDYFSDFYPDLVPAAMALQTPVLTFATHSLAGFFLYLFFYLSLRTYAARGGIFFLLAAGVNIALCALLESVTGYLFFVLGCAQLVWHAVSRRALAALLLPVAAAGILALALSLNWLDSQEIGATISGRLGSDVNGFAGRYGTTGRENENIDFLARQPFSPIGFTSPAGLFIADSGPVEYLLRGSLPLLVSVYGGLWLFLRSNLRSRREAWTLFVIFLIFEIGFANLVYLRTVFVLPFLVVYLNALREPAPSRLGTGTSASELAAAARAV